MSLSTELPYNVNYDTSFGVWWAVGYTEYETEYYAVAWNPMKREWAQKSWRLKERVGVARTVD